ncbi:MAG: c-type cytochrome [Anaerolineae bacterium]|nr:c-type cytochrome [Anaerolineae bacterium]
MSSKSFLTVVLLVVLSLIATACGSIATPRPAGPDTPAPIEPSSQEQAADEGNAVAEAPTEAPTATDLPTETPTEIPPTSTPTEVPPTATPTDLPTATPAPETDLAAAGDAARGDQLFHSGVDAAPACVTCHVVDEDRVLIGPSMVGIATHAGERVEGMSAAEYLREAILEPNAYLVENTDTNVFSAGGVSLMFQQYGDYLSEQDVSDLIAYMLSLE